MCVEKCPSGFGYPYKDASSGGKSDEEIKKEMLPYCLPSVRK